VRLRGMLTNTPHFKLKRRRLFYILDTYRTDTDSSVGQRVRSVD
jgi:hypothetical protein